MWTDVDDDVDIIHYVDGESVIPILSQRKMVSFFLSSSSFHIIIVHVLLYLNDGPLMGNISNRLLGFIV